MNEHVDTIEVELVVEREHLGSESGSLGGSSHSGRKVAGDDQRKRRGKSQNGGREAKEKRGREREDSRGSSPTSDTELDVLSSGVSGRDNSVDCTTRKRDEGGKGEERVSELLESKGRRI